MTARRISRGTPYILTGTEISETLKHLSPRIETAIATLMNLSVEQWRGQPDKVKAKQLVDFQAAGTLAATMAASERAIGDLEAAAYPTVTPANADDLVDSVIEGLHKRGLIVINPSNAQKKGA